MKLGEQVGTDVNNAMGNLPIDHLCNLRIDTCMLNLEDGPNYFFTISNIQNIYMNFQHNLQNT